MNNEKLLLVDDAGEICDKLRTQGKSIVTTNGVFDILHVGHIRYLQKAKSSGDVLIVGVNSDASVKRYKGEKRPLNEQSDRAECLAALSCVDYVVVFDEDTPERLLEMVKPSVHVKGGDYSMSEIVEKHVVEEGGGRVELVDMHDGYSTTLLIKKIIDVYSQKKD